MNRMEEEARHHAIYRSLREPHLRVVIYEDKGMWFVRNEEQPAPNNTRLVASYVNGKELSNTNDNE